MQVRFAASHSRGCRSGITITSQFAIKECSRYISVGSQSLYYPYRLALIPRPCGPAVDQREEQKGAAISARPAGAEHKGALKPKTFVF